MKRSEIVQKLIPIIILSVIAILMIHPAVRIHKTSIGAGWLFSTLVFYPAIFIVQRALREEWKIAHLIPLVLMTFRMIALMISLLILTKFKKEWLIPFSVVLLSSLPVYLIFEIRRGNS
jgi:hypothetical protein